MEIVKDYLLHFSFILFPIFLYQVFWLSKPDLLVPRANRLLVAVFAASSSLLCTAFPIQELHSVRYGLQLIPIIVCLLYSGTAAGLAAGAASVFFQLIWFEPSALFFLSLIPFLITIPIQLQTKWPFFSKRKKLLFALLIGCTETALLTASVFIYSATNIFNFQNPSSVYYEAAVSVFFQVSALLLCIYLIEIIDENASMRARLIHSEKMAVVSELAASVAHEVRNPLTVVRGFVQLLFSGEQLQDKSHSGYQKLVLSELDRAQTIITNYLDMAKQDDYEKEKFDISLLVKETGSLMESYAHFKSVTVTVRSEPDLYVFGDVKKLKQAFINLIKNSIEAVPSENGRIEVSVQKQEEMILIQITDNGIGMSDEELQKLGKPYYTLKTNGTGLGLTVTFSIIQHHEGSVYFTSGEHSGTTASVRLPAAVH
ncbi:sensor histidine kinase [Bacillus amyloliquefaciens]|jgi:two-component system sporulation sensor kinase B|uniref:sensor histidine kinase n=1 Tax=Bacillus amyloliquefaciens TaxID=1390 RepID=UPI001580DE56|nr:HAMP domain-containing sensor histidine kinase [Bacillus amyloliquefaciens]NUI21641.1 HAMP domain-containing histidine kinase [Bacillus amyloliquefaciens]NUI29994.1 HAMP domain-containing histidine kinase [Bacillus amyloliquefaciens]NUI34334.1 HAMP domain-containing histidine kinase [Bacillus amyloliquefaciens]NUI67547.1 HAMP domain-containing histidine kinase [Bacillus amyloliquefaciens]NUI71890.1 HAMP domain-containing histidine kinase [Bacillus amyloliquefaciens]